jgi:hypothetical protein
LYVYVHTPGSCQDAMGNTPDAPSIKRAKDFDTPERTMFDVESELWRKALESARESIASAENSNAERSLPVDTSSSESTPVATQTTPTSGELDERLLRNITTKDFEAARCTVQLQVQAANYSREHAQSVQLRVGVLEGKLKAAVDGEHYTEAARLKEEMRVARKQTSQSPLESRMEQIRLLMGQLAAQEKYTEAAFVKELIKSLKQNPPALLPPVGPTIGGTTPPVDTSSSETSTPNSPTPAGPTIGGTTPPVDTSSSETSTPNGPTPAGPTSGGTTPPVDTSSSETSTPNGPTPAGPTSDETSGPNTTIPEDEACVFEKFTKTIANLSGPGREAALMNLARRIKVTIVGEEYSLERLVRGAIAVKAAPTIHAVIADEVIRLGVGRREYRKVVRPMYNKIRDAIGWEDRPGATLCPKWGTMKDTVVEELNKGPNKAVHKKKPDWKSGGTGCVWTEVDLYLAERLIAYR